ncbi:TatD family hydrolase [Spiroplasma endosymbiont of Dactylopius coccus]|nr:TatD family hydrolase [Spiroplasma ixodetis]
MANNGIFDTHCHLMSKHYDETEILKLLTDAYSAGDSIGSICNVGFDLNTSKQAVSQIYEFESEEKIPNLYAVVGIHPTEVNTCDSNTISELKKLIATGKVVAIGEIGLDYYHKFTEPQLQKKWFIEQLKLAKEHKLPVLLHIRNAFEDVFEIIKKENITNGVLHCFTGTKVIAEKFIKQGFYISFAGNVTYKNALKLQEVAKNIPINKILVETDAPYLTPEPKRGKNPKNGLTINHPENIIFTVNKIAELKKIPKQSIINATRENAINVFKLNNELKRNNE